ncbi:cell division protein FtsL [Methylobacterium sp. ID0610]|uniref:cell division protein FtsL n=1 Tax=Methylobacterium carpenticola TaxID=3344827 RepID=UPI0036B36678
MIRLLHLLAIAGLIASAVYAYSIKYDTLYQAEQVAKLKSRLRREREATAVLRAEWQLLTRPDRLQAAVDKYLQLEPIGTEHLGRLADLPAKADRGDEIARKLESLGLLATATPTGKERPAATTNRSAEEPRTTGSTSASRSPRTSTRTPTATR